MQELAGIPGHSISMQECVTFGNRMSALSMRRPGDFPIGIIKAFMLISWGCEAQIFTFSALMLTQQGPKKQILQVSVRQGPFFF